MKIIGSLIINLLGSVICLPQDYKESSDYSLKIPMDGAYIDQDHFDKFATIHLINKKGYSQRSYQVEREFFSPDSYSVREVTNHHLDDIAKILRVDIN